RPECPVAEIALLSESERMWLREWGVNEHCYPGAEAVHHLIEWQAARQPGATALLFNDEQLSYAELNCRANRLAHQLIGLGVKPEARVGIASERSMEMVVALLGVLKSGGAYVPIEPEYRPERIAYILEDSSIELLLTQSDIRDQLPHS